MLTVFHDLFFQPAIFPLLTIARVTERVRLGPAALNATTLHPVEIAGQTAALDLASGGRAYAGIVTGSWLDRLGIEEDRPLTRLREAVEVVRRVLAGDTSGFAGERGPSAELAQLAAVHGYTTAFFWSAAIFAIGGLVAWALLSGGAPEADPDAPAELAFAH